MHFDFESYAFKEGWILNETTLFDADKEVNDYAFDKDSLKTHPDISLRIKMLHEIVGNDAVAMQPPTDKLREIKHLVALLTISNSIDERRVDLALYQTLVLYNKNEIDQKTYCNLVSQLLQNVYELKVSHQFGKYVTPVSPFSDEKYLNEVRQFLHNVELKNIKKIGLNFCNKYLNVMENDIDFKKTTAYFNKLNL